MTGILGYSEAEQANKGIDREVEGGVVDTEASTELNVDFLSETSSPNTSSEATTNKRKIAGALLIGVSAVALAAYYLLPASDADTEDDLAALYSDGAAKEGVVDTYVGQENFNDDNLASKGQEIIDNVQAEEGKQYQIPVIEGQNGRSTTNGKIRLEETKRSTVDHEAKGDAASTSKSLITERRDLGMELDQRLNDAKIQEGLVVSKGGAASWAKGESDGAASSSGRILIIGGDVKSTDRTIDTEAAEIGSTSVQFDIGAAEEKSITDVVGGVGGILKGGIKGIITDSVKDGLKGSLTGN